uniref:Odorant-binding protein 11 n=1 Tax=Yemma signatus TaxID=300820 RepID=A0A3G2GRS3_9HEMI|nr:odorant-binding protein 11 [Yemma signatus]
MEECSQELGLPLPPGPPPADGAGPPKPPSPTHRACMEQCIFNKQGLLTSDMQLNPEAIMKKETENFGSDAIWGPIVQAAVQSCIETAPSMVPADGQCKSGASELRRCIMRTVYLNCPSNLMSQSDSCNAERALLEQCPNLHPHPPRPGN